MNGTLARVFAVYPLAIPLAFVALSMAFPGYVSFDQDTQDVTLRFNVKEVGAALAVAYAVIAGVFAKWGIKK